MPGWLSSSPLSTPARSPKKRRDQDTVMDSDDDVPAHDLDDKEDGDEPEENNDVYDVEFIVNHRHRGRALEYLIRWKGWDPSFDSWEPAENVEAPDLVEEYEARAAAKAARKAAKAKSTPKPSRSSRTPSVIPTSRSRSVGRFSSVASTSTIDSGNLTIRNGNSRRDNKEKSFFYRVPNNDLPDLIIPTASAFCEESFSKIRKHFEKRRSTLFALHPATLVLLRVPEKTAHLEAKQRFRNAIKQIADEAEEKDLAILSYAALPKDSSFQHTAVDTVLRGGEPFKLAWPFGLEHSSISELCHILAAVQHIRESQSRYRCRVLIRKRKPNLVEIASYYNVHLLDLESARQELRGG